MLSLFKLWYKVQYEYFTSSELDESLSSEDSLASTVTKNFNAATMTLVILEKQPVDMTLTVFVSLQIFFLYKSTIMP